ncbi:MAG TPA: hypothetical protein DCS93_40455 [Microscillaceae bacterium]|nr:hypothetical protein [Microscillaceae bacterium]
MANQNEFAERLRNLIEELNMNKNSFSVKLGVSPTIIHNIIDGRGSKPSYEVLHKIVTTFKHVNAYWLLMGEGDMLIQSNEKEKLVLSKSELELKNEKIVLYEELLKAKEETIVSQKSENQLLKKEILRLEQALDNTQKSF